MEDPFSDLANGVISLARGNYVDAGLSFAAAIPFLGNAATATKIGKKVIGKADDVLAGAKWVNCKATGKGCFVAGTKVWVSSEASQLDRAPLVLSSLRGAWGEETLSASALLEAPSITKTAIESVAIGSRLAGENPQPWEYDDSLPEPVQADWSLVTFSMTREDGSEIEVEMIRPTDFWQQQGTVAGAQIFMEFPELDVSTHATVRKVEPCPPIAAGTGNVVTARIVTLTATDLVSITLETGETITGTPPHPVWSVEQDDWIELGEIEEGDHVLTEHGPLEVIATEYRTTAETVYNVEVHGHHVYHIGDDGVLVHNASKYNNGSVAKALRGFQNKTYNVGGIQLHLTAKGMRHIHVRHVKGFWNGQKKAAQTFLKLDQKQIKSVVGQVLQQNVDRVRAIGARGIGQVEGVVNGVRYTVGLNRGSIGQFYRH